LLTEAASFAVTADGSNTTTTPTGSIYSVATPVTAPPIGPGAPPVHGPGYIIGAAIGGIIVAIGLIVTGIYRIKRYRVKRSLAGETESLTK
jgi:hypothetical protein